jgi:hypothetical protein
MGASQTEAGAQALDFLSRRYRESLRLGPVDSLPAPIYGFDPNGWHLFAVTERIAQRVGATQYVAVSQSTGEVRYLGRVGQ